jgi:methylmalonyl-CoA/ethylmalonyl-CoA epimerase
MATKIDHLGIAVKSLEQSIPVWEKALGVKCGHIEEVVEQKVKTAFFSVGESHIELLEPTSPESPVAKFLEKNGEGVHHVAFGSLDLVADLAKAKADGIRLIDETPRKGAGGKDIAFLHPKSMGGVLTELCSGGNH